MKLIKSVSLSSIAFIGTLTSLCIFKVTGSQTSRDPAATSAEAPRVYLSSRGNLYSCGVLDQENEDDQGSAGQSAEAPRVFRSARGNLYSCEIVGQENEHGVRSTYTGENTCFGPGIPFRFSSRQAIVISSSYESRMYATLIYSELRNDGFKCDIDSSEDLTLDQMISRAKANGYSFIFVVDNQDLDEGTVNVRFASPIDTCFRLPTQELIQRLQVLQASDSSENVL